MKNIILFLLLFALIPGTVLAETMAAGCHCFKNRVYDPRQKFAADEYILTTTFNSLIARVFGISKQQIIMMKMRGGIPSDDLTVALFAARENNTDMNLLLSLHKTGDSWSTIFSSPEFPIKDRESLLGRIAAGMDDFVVADQVTREIIRDYFKISLEKVAGFMKAGVVARELVFSLTMAEHSGKQPSEIISMYRKKKKSWSEIAADFGLSAKETGRLLYDAPGFQFPGS